MSRAFVKEADNDWLGDVEPKLEALERYLARENNGVVITSVRNYIDPESGRTIYEMSNGESYMIDEDNRWLIV